MTSLEKALKIAVDQALITHDKGYEAAAFHHLHRAVKLLAGLAIAQEAAALRQNQPQDAPEAPEGTNPPPEWESVAKRQAKGIDTALVFLRQGWPKAAEKALELVPDVVIKGP